MIRVIRVVLFAAAFAAFPGKAQNAVTSAAPSPFTYADLADLALPAPVAVEVRVRRATKIAGAAAATVPPGRQRYLIEADVNSVIRASRSLPPRLEWLYDAPRDAKGKLPKLVKARVIAFGLPVAGKPASLQLSAPDAQIAQIPGDATRVRTILTAALAADAPPVVTGVGNAFHVPGTLEGEGESQIFLTTSDGRPISFNVVRTPGEAARWSVSIDEIVDASAAQPPRDTLLWYRLACFLPPALPAASVEGQPEDQARILAEDYRTAMKGLGVCQRNRRG